MKEFGTSSSRRVLRGSVMTTALAAIVAVAACAPAASTGGAVPDADERAATAPVGRTVLAGVYTAPQATRGSQEFQQTCASCHSPAEFSGPVFQRIWDGRSVGELYQVISTMMPQNDPGSLSPQEYTDIITFVLRQNGYPEGDSELPADPIALGEVIFQPAE